MSPPIYVILVVVGLVISFYVSMMRDELKQQASKQEPEVSK